MSMSRTYVLVGWSRTVHRGVQRRESVEARPCQMRAEPRERRSGNVLKCSNLGALSPSTLLLVSELALDLPTPCLPPRPPHPDPTPRTTESSSSRPSPTSTPPSQPLSTPTSSRSSPPASRTRSARSMETSTAQSCSSRSATLSKTSCGVSLCLAACFWSAWACRTDKKD